jgi:hypothetical protein
MTSTDQLPFDYSAFVKLAHRVEKDIINTRVLLQAGRRSLQTDLNLPESSRRVLEKGYVAAEKNLRVSEGLLTLHSQNLIAMWRALAQVRDLRRETETTYADLMRVLDNLIASATDPQDKAVLMARRDEITQRVDRMLSGF